MSHLLRRIPTSAQLRKLESDWIKSCSDNWGVVLMEVAGLNASKVALEMWQLDPGPVTVLCGRGNNGGDGFVIARHLARHGIPVGVFAVEGGKSASAENSVNRRLAENCGLKVNDISANDLEPIKTALFKSSLVVDALLGTGLDRPVEGIYSEAIKFINDSGKPVLSVDIPSGLNSDTGQVMGAAVEADCTVTFGYLKAGLLNYPGPLHCGSLVLVDIGLPDLDHLPESLDSQQYCDRLWWLMTASQANAWLPSRDPDSHKGTFGRLLGIAGSTNMPGAAMLAARSSLRTGSGLSVLATPKSLLNHLPQEEIIYKGLSETASGTISPEAIKDLESEMESANAIMLGPGISSNVETIKFVQQLVSSIKKPCVVDADALNAISQNQKQTLGAAEQFVFTPHPKELSRLTGLSTQEIQADRLSAAETACKKFGCTIVLKGAHSVVASPDQGSYIVTTGNPGMATAGSGDVLTGIIGALLAQGLSPAHAAGLGTYLHGMAGDMAAENIGEDGMVASDIMKFIPIAIDNLRNEEFSGSNFEMMLSEAML